MIERTIRAMNPSPIAFGILNGARLRLWQATVDKEEATALPGTLVSVDKTGIQVATGRGHLLLTHLQFPGKTVQPVAALLNRHPCPFIVGHRFQ